MTKRQLSNLPLVLTAILLLPPARAQDELESSSGAAPTLERRKHEGFWPFYSREEYEDGSVRYFAVFGAVRSVEMTNGDYYQRVFPFFSSSLADGNDFHLSLYPLLYTRRRSPNHEHDIFLPFFAWWREHAEENTLLWPLFHSRYLPEGPFGFFPTLYGYGSWPQGTQHRLGAPYVLDLFESSDDGERHAWAVGTVAPWNAPTRSTLSLAKSVSSTNGAWHSHVFPLFADGAGADGESRYFHTLAYGSWRTEDGTTGTVLPPLLTWWSQRGDSTHDFHTLGSLVRVYNSPAASSLRVLPFYWSRENHESERADHYFPALLSHFGSTPDESTLNVLYPLGHYSRGPGREEVRALPLFDSGHDESSNWLGVGMLAYRRHENLSTQSVNHWVLTPFVRWQRSPNDRTLWVLPLFLDSRRQTESERRQATFVAPSFYYGRREASDPTGDARTTSETLHLWPFYGQHHSIDEESAVATESFATLWPFFRAREKVDMDNGDLVERQIHAPWPLTRYKSDRESYDFRLFPFLFFGEGRLRSYDYYYPLFSSERGPSAERNVWNRTSVVQYYDDLSSRELSLFPGIFSWREELTLHSLEIDAVGFRPVTMFSYGEGPDRGHMHLLPLGFGSWDGEQSRVGIFPFFYRRQYASQSLDYWPLPRVFFVWNNLVNDGESYHALLWKAFEYTSGESGDYDFRILHRLVVNRDVQGQREIVVNPLFGYDRDERTGRQSFSILKFLYRYDVEDGTATHRALFIPVYRSAVE